MTKTTFRFRVRTSTSFIAMTAMMATSIAPALAAIDNTATVNGEIGGTPVYDVGNPPPQDSESVPVEAKAPSMVVEKSGTLNDDDATTGLSAGDTVTYAITVENDGNVTLTNVALSDTLVNGDSTALSYDTALPSAPDSGDTDSDGELDVGETWVYSATYTITQDDIDSGSLTNTLDVTADDPDSVSITEDSDDPTDPTNTDPDADGDPEDPTVTTFTTTPGLVVIKDDTLNDDDTSLNASVGDTIDYTITAENTGNVSLTGVTPTDTLTNAAGTQTLTLSAPTGDTDSDGEIDPDETWTWTASYTLVQADIESGSVSNAVVVVTDQITDTSDDPDDPTGDDDPTVTPLPAAPALTIAKVGVLSKDPGNTGTNAEVGDLITYTYTVANTGNTIVNDVVVSDTHEGVQLLPTGVTSGPWNETLTVGTLSDDTTSGTNGSWDALYPGETITFTYEHTVTQAEFDAQ